MKTPVLFLSTILLSSTLFGQVSSKLSEKSNQNNNPINYNLSSERNARSTGCEFHEQLGNSLEDGRPSNVLAPLLCADDITLNPNECWNIEAIEVPFFTSNVNDASQINITFFEDNMGQPGNIHSSQTISPAEWTTSLIGNNHGLDVYLFEIDLNTNFNICGGPTGATFWFSVQIVNSFASFFWEFSTTQPYGSNGHYSGNTAGPWTMVTDNYVFKLLIADEEAPVADVATLTDVNEPCEVVSITPPTATDNCDGSVSGTTSTSFPVSTTTTITWEYTDASGNTATQTQEVIINDNDAPVPDQTPLPTVDEACEVTNITPPTATDNCNGSIQGTTATTFPITSSMTITWTFEDASGNVSTETQEVIVNTPDVSTSLNGNTITASNNNPGVTYQWIDCSDNSAVAGETQQSFTSTVEGNFAVVLTENGCTDTSNCVEISFSGLNEFNLSNSIELYPIPSKSEITVITELEGKAKIIDYQGRIIKELSVDHKETLIDISDLSSGIYFFRIGEVNKKFIKQ